MENNKIKFASILKYNLYFWSAWLIFYSLIFYRNIPDIPYYGNILLSLVITKPLFCLSLLVWPVVRRLQFIRFRRYQIVIIHLIMANLYTIFWLGIYYGIMLSIYGKMLYTFFNVPETIGWQYPSGITFYLMITGAYYSVIYYREIKTKEINESQLQLLLKETQFKALKNQLNPHFLFNSLNSINALIKSDPDKARSMLVKLSDLFRLSLNNQANSFVPLQQELEFAHAFLDIEKIRLDERLKYDEVIAGNVQDALVPSMFIQPLIENSIKHGIAPSSKKGFVELKIEAEQNWLNISISNSIPSQSDLNQKSKIQGNGVGLDNLKNRLNTLYNNQFHFSSGKKHENTFNVDIKIPIEKNESQVL